jgi:hypothetical protein
MSEIKFSKNFSDHSVHSGTDAGFQFEFYCERCNDAWRSEFSPFRGGQASSWLGRAATKCRRKLGGDGLLPAIKYSATVSVCQRQNPSDCSIGIAIPRRKPARSLRRS